jgi:UDP-N-acetylmuramoylalanine--D-glutamate ligase
MDLRGKKVTVVGLGRSGMAACELLLEKGAQVSITDCMDNRAVRENAGRIRDKRNVIDIETGRHTEGLIDGRDLVVVSPGVPGDCLPIARAGEKGISVIGELELAFAFCPAPIIAITGTNGKTTVTTLVGEIFRQAGRRAVVCGNIGVPFSSEVKGLKDKDVVVLEVSSFQLETIDKFRPRVAVMLNLSVDHLDRYRGLNEYFSAKCRLFSNQGGEDWAVFSKEDRYTPAFAAKTKARVVYFSKRENSGGKREGLNSNHLAALTISSLFAVPQDTAVQACRNFKGIEHRLEDVAERDGIQFINDSKATNVSSTLWALNSIRKPIILIAGGLDKGSKFASIREKVKNKVRAMVLFGQAAEKIRDAIGDSVLIKTVTSLEDAVGEAFGLARPGDCVLLSPMCASFDMFRDYAQRGRVFKQAVNDLIR